jgi:hypothetical protein
MLKIYLNLSKHAHFYAAKKLYILKFIMFEKYTTADILYIN